MLSFFRGHTKKIFWGLVAIIVPAFSLWGIGATMMDRMNNPVIGAVAGFDVDQRQFLAEKGAVRRLMEIELADMVGGQGYNREWVRNYIQSQDLDQITWKRLALSHLADVYGFGAGRQIVAAWLRGIRMFNSEAGFDYPAYLAFLRDTLHVDPVLFEDEMRRELVGRIVLKVMSLAAFSSQADETELWRMRRERISVKAAFFAAGKMAVDPALMTDDALRRHFGGHAGDFIVPLRRSGSFVFMSYSAVPAPEVTEDAVAAYYGANPALFFVEGDASRTRPLDEVRDQIRKSLEDGMRAESVHERARTLYYSLVSANADASSFASAAAAAGLEARNTGWLAEGDAAAAELLVPGSGDAFIHDFFAAAIGAAMPPLAVEGGVVLFVAESEEPAHAPSFEDVRDEVGKAFAAAKGLEAAAAKADEFSKGFSSSSASADEASFAGLAVNAGAEVSDLEPFSLLAPSGYARGFSFSELAALFSCPVSSVSKAFASDGGWVVFFVRGYDDKQPGEAAAAASEADGQAEKLEYARQAAYKKQLAATEEMLSGVFAPKEQ